MQITSEYRVIHKTGSKEHEQLTVNKKDSRLNKNRIAAKNEILQTVLCSQIDNKIDSIKKLEYRQNRAEQQKQSRQAKRR